MKRILSALTLTTLISAFSLPAIATPATRCFMGRRHNDVVCHNFDAAGRLIGSRRIDRQGKDQRIQKRITRDFSGAFEPPNGGAPRETKGGGSRLVRRGR